MPHYIKPNHASHLPSQIVVVDTEAKQVISRQDKTTRSQTLRCGVAKCLRRRKGKYEQENSTRFTSSELFWKWFYGRLSKHRLTWVFAHNMPYDATLLRLWHECAEKRIIGDKPRSKRNKAEYGDGETGTHSLAVIDDPPFILGCLHPDSGGRFVLVDTFNWFRCSLDDIGQQVGVPKSEFPGFDAGVVETLSYCEGDVDTLLTAVKKLIDFVDNHNLGMFRWTGPGQSMAGYRHRFMPTKQIKSKGSKGVELDTDEYRTVGIICPHGDREAQKIERASYFGGQTECYRLGKFAEKLYMLDVNSLYPKVMRENLFPYRLKSKWEGAKSGKWRNGIDPLNCIAEVVVDVGEDSMPCRVGGKPLSLRGRFPTVLAGPELSYANEVGYIKSIGRVIEYSMADLFSRFVDYFYDERLASRLKGDDFGESLCKMMLNSLTGKWATKGNKWKSVPGEIPSQPFTSWSVLNSATGEVIEKRALGWTVQVKDTDEFNANACVAISSFICSYGRQFMRQVIEAAGRENVYYLATDAVIVNEEGMRELHDKFMLSEVELGGLKVAGEGCNAEISAIGTYSIGEKRAASGMRANAIMKADGSWEQDNFRVSSRLFNNGPVGNVIVTRENFNRSRVYGKGLVDNEGRTRSFTYDEAQAYVDGFTGRVWPTVQIDG